MLQSNDCGCVICECTVSGEGVIIWTGSAFDCPSGVYNEITLLVLDRGTVECNNGTVKARKNNNYTSQLIITDRSLNGSNIECVHENGTNSNVIGNLSIPIIKGHSGRYCTVTAVTAIQAIINNYAEPLSPPIDFQLVHVYTDQLVFKWNKSDQCSSLQYEISATGCGNCPNHTVNNSITCGNVPVNKSTGESLCMFAVNSVVCEHSESSLNTVNVILKGSAYYTDYDL